MYFPVRQVTARALIVAAVALAGALTAAPRAGAAEELNRMVTWGGAREGGVITRITSLADSGPGTLREALETVKDPSVIVFEVGGEIVLKEDLYIRKSQVTIAGQTAPAPGITLTGASLRVRASDVAIEHIAIRPGMHALPADRADGLTIGGGNRAPERVRIRNISVSWSKDELTSIAHPTEGPVSITNSIFAEALRSAGHPKGEHSMGLLVRDAPKGATLAGNLFISNVHRNPVIGSNTIALVTNNWIVNPRFNAMHVYLDDVPEKLEATFIHNVMTPGQDTAIDVEPLNLQPDDEVKKSGATIMQDDNRVIDMESLAAMDLERWLPDAPATSEMDPADVPTYVLRYAGAVPARRDAIDLRLIGEALAGEARIVDRPSEEVDKSSTTAEFVGPPNPFEVTPSGNTRIELWLEQLHVEAGGVPGFRIN